MRTMNGIEWRKKAESCEYANDALKLLEKFFEQVKYDVNQNLNPNNQVTADILEVFNCLAFKIAPLSYRSEGWYENNQNVNTVFLGTAIHTTKGVYTGLAMVMQHKVLWDVVDYISYNMVAVRE